MFWQLPVDHSNESEVDWLILQTWRLAYSDDNTIRSARHCNFNFRSCSFISSITKASKIIIEIVFAFERFLFSPTHQLHLNLYEYINLSMWRSCKKLHQSFMPNDTCVIRKIITIIKASRISSIYLHAIWRAREHENRNWNFSRRIKRYFVQKSAHFFWLLMLPSHFTDYRLQSFARTGNIFVSATLWHCVTMRVRASH